MNIWYVSAYDQPEGESSRTYDYATELTALGHRVTFFTSSYNHFTHEERLNPDEKLREEWFGKVRVIWLKTIPYKDNGFWRGVNMLSNAWRAYWAGKTIKESPDIIFGPSVPLFTGLAAFFLSKRKKCYFCFEVRDIWPQALVDLGVLSKNSPVVWVFRKIEVFLYLHADKIIAVLPFAYKHICQYGIHPDRISWIPNGVDLKRFDCYKPYQGGEQGNLTVMYVGGFTSTHGIEPIFEAAKCLQYEKNKDIRFVIVGVDKKKKQYKYNTYVHQAENIEFRDSIPKSQVACVQEEADVLIASVKNTNVYQFGINSNKIFDYLASGRPIVFAANSPNNPVADANAGISILPEDPKAMVNAIKTIFFMPPYQRRLLGENGKRYARKHFDIRILARKLEHILLELMESKTLL
jgi:glycosyltransferase involved in cell wall biosynthesis